MITRDGPVFAHLAKFRLWLEVTDFNAELHLFELWICGTAKCTTKSTTNLQLIDQVEFALQRLLWSPYGIGKTIIFCRVVSFFFLLSFFSFLA